MFTFPVWLVFLNHKTNTNVTQTQSATHSNTIAFLPFLFNCLWFSSLLWHGLVGGRELRNPRAGIEWFSLSLGGDVRVVEQCSEGWRTAEESLVACSVLVDCRGSHSCNGVDIEQAVAITLHGLTESVGQVGLGDRGEGHVLQRYNRVESLFYIRFAKLPALYL